MYSSLHGRLDRVLRIVENVSAAVAGCAALIAMLLVSADAVMRHLFARPLTFQLFLTENYLLVAMLLLALPWGYRTGGLVRITGLVDALGTRTAGLIARLGLVGSALYIGYLAVLGAGSFWEAWQSGEVEMGVVDWPVAWSWIFVPVGTGLLSIRLFMDTLSASPFGREAMHGVD